MTRPDPDHHPFVLQAAFDAACSFFDRLPQRAAGASVAAMPATDFAVPTGAEAALSDFRTRFEAGLSGSAGPRYWGFVTGGATPAALAGDWLAGAYDQNVSNDIGSIASQVERETVAGLRDLFGLPDDVAGVFVSGATQSNLVALATARQAVYARLGHDVAQQGLSAAPPLRVLAGAAHSSILKAMAVLGLGRDALQPVATLPGRTAVDVAAMAKVLASGEGRPTIVVASAGEVNTGDFDDLVALADLCAQHRAWLHVDGAFGLFAALSPDHASRLRGVERADSVTVDLHKWLNVPYDSAVVFTREPESQRAVFRASSAYLGDSTDPLHYTPENSRRFRALPAWMTLRAYGRDGIAEWVQRDCTLARAFAEGLRGIDGIDVLSDVHLNIVCFALRHGDAAARDAFLDRLNRDGRVFMTPTVLFGRPGIRAALSNWMTQPEDIEIALAAVRDTLRD